MFGVVARWGPWRRDSSGDSASACVWLDANGWSRCTCAGTDRHQDNQLFERATTCKHARTFDGMLDELAVELGATTSLLRHHLCKSGRPEPADAAGQDAFVGETFHVAGALYVAVCSSMCGPLPVPLYLTSTRSSCSICPGARTRVCSHLVVAQESGAPQRFNRMSAQSSGPRLVASSVSRLPIPLHDCVAAVRVNADITAKVLTGEVFVLPAPTRCGYCASKNVPHTLLQSSTRRGVIACTGGFCHMDVHVTKCSSCKQWVSRDGRDEHIVLLTLTTAGTVSWARAIAHDASEGVPTNVRLKV